MTLKKRKRKKEGEIKREAEQQQSRKRFVYLMSGYRSSNIRSNRIGHRPACRAMNNPESGIISR